MKFDKYVSIRIPHGVHAAILGMASEAGESISEVVRRMMERELRQDGALKQERPN